MIIIVDTTYNKKIEIYINYIIFKFVICTLNTIFLIQINESLQIVK